MIRILTSTLLGKKNLFSKNRTNTLLRKEKRKSQKKWLQVEVVAKVRKRISGQHEENPKGGALGSLDRAGSGAKDRNQKNESLANDRNQRQNKILDDENIDGDIDGVYATESVDIGAIKGVDDRKRSQNDKLADATDEQASRLPVSHRKKKKKVRMMGEGIVVGEKDLNPQDNPLMSQIKTTKCTIMEMSSKSHSSEMKEKKKKKKQDLDDYKHLGKKRKIERNEVVWEEATDESDKETGKSYEKSDVKYTEGDVQDGNAKG